MYLKTNPNWKMSSTKYHPNHYHFLSQLLAHLPQILLLQMAMHIYWKWHYPPKPAQR